MTLLRRHAHALLAAVAWLALAAGVAAGMVAEAWAGGKER